MAKARITRSTKLFFAACRRQPQSSAQLLSRVDIDAIFRPSLLEAPGASTFSPVNAGIRGTRPFIPPSHRTTPNNSHPSHLRQTQASLSGASGPPLVLQGSSPHLVVTHSGSAAPLGGALSTALRAIRWVTTDRIDSAELPEGPAVDTQNAVQDQPLSAAHHGLSQSCQEPGEDSEKQSGTREDIPAPSQESYFDADPTVDNPTYPGLSTAGREPAVVDAPGIFHEGVDSENRERLQGVCARFGFSNEQFADACSSSPHASLQDPADVEACLELLVSEGVPTEDLPAVASGAHILSQADSFPEKVEFMRSLGFKSMRRLLVEYPSLWHTPLKEMRETSLILKMVFSTRIAEVLLDRLPTLLVVPHLEMGSKLTSLRQLLGHKVLKVVARANPMLLQLPRSLITKLSHVFGTDDGRLRNFLRTVDVRTLDEAFEAKLSLLTTAFGEKATKRLALEDPRMVQNAEEVMAVFSHVCEFVPHGEALRLLRENSDLFLCNWNEKVGPTLELVQARLGIPPKKVLVTGIWGQAFSVAELDARLSFLEREGIEVADSKKAVKKLKRGSKDGVSLSFVLQPRKNFTKQFRHYEGP